MELSAVALLNVLFSLRQQVVERVVTDALSEKTKKYINI